jgi:hypothetical protein
MTGKQFPLNCFVFDMDFFQKVFDGVFELPWLRNAQQFHNFKIKLIKKRVPTYLI